MLDPTAQRKHMIELVTVRMPFGKFKGILWVENMETHVLILYKIFE